MNFFSELIARHAYEGKANGSQSKALDATVSSATWALNLLFFLSYTCLEKHICLDAVFSRTWTCLHDYEHSFYVSFPSFFTSAEIPWVCTLSVEFPDAANC